MASHKRYQHPHRCQGWQLVPDTEAVPQHVTVSGWIGRTVAAISILTMVASVATLKPLPRVVISVFGASDGGESKNVLLTP